MPEPIATWNPVRGVWETNRGGASRIVLRALGAVLGDLADLGFDAEWVSLSASDVGAAHGRKRVFVIAWPADTAGDTGRLVVGNLRSAAGADGVVNPGGPGNGTAADVRLLKTPTSQLAINGGSQHPSKRKAGGHGPTFADEVEHLLPTPKSSDGKRGDSPSERERNSPSLAAVGSLLPTPRVSDGAKGGPNQRGSSDDLMLGDIVYADRWAEYGRAIGRWEPVIGRPAPEPTKPSPKTGNPQLSAMFVEWLMGCDQGWVTDVPGLTRNQMLRLLGNGVVAWRVMT